MAPKYRVSYERPNCVFLRRDKFTGGTKSKDARYGTIARVANILSSFQQLVDGAR